MSDICYCCDRDFKGCLLVLTVSAATQSQNPNPFNTKGIPKKAAGGGGQAYVLFPNIFHINPFSL